MLKIIPYHQRVSDYFKAQTKTWDFFAAAKTKEEHVGKYRTELLKNTYKFDPATDAALYQQVDFAKEKLGLRDLEVILHQAQYSDELNASIAYLENEAHIVFSGQLLQLLDEAERQAVIAHELTHVKFYTEDGGKLEITSRIINAIGNNYNSDAAYLETARLFRLYNEIYCDRGAYTVLEDIGPIVTSLVKSATGLNQVHADSYLKQAEEIFSSETDLRANSVSHPENYIRARAIRLWHEKKDEAEGEIIRMIEGMIHIDQLDIFNQKALAEFTRKFLQLFLKPKWFRSPLIASHARQYFTDFAWDEDVTIQPALREKIEASDRSIADYLAYILLDFIFLDSALEEVPHGWAFQFAEDVGLKDAFDAVVKKELKFSDKKLEQHKRKTLQAYYGVKEGEGEQIYE